MGVLDAKRMPAPFRINTFVLENWDLVYALGIEAAGLGRSGLARMGPCCTVEEENWQSQQLPGFPGGMRRTCLDENASIRRRPIPMVRLDQRRPLLGIMFCSCSDPVAKIL